MAKRRNITGPKKKHKTPNSGASGQPQESGSDTSHGRRANAITNSRPTAVVSDVSSLSGRVGTKRKSRVTIESVDDMNDVRSPKRFAARPKPRLRYINQDVVMTKWEVLPEHIQQQVRELFVAAERPVITRHPEDKRRIEVQAALSTVTRTLAKRLPRMPFPTKTKEEHFDYEALINKSLTLEHQLTLILHSMALLESQITKEERLLTRERADLTQLKRNARAELNIRSRQTAKRPGVLQAGIGVKEAEDNATSIGLIKVPATKLPASEMDLDISLQPMVRQLRDHLESMETNATPTKGMNAALSETVAVLEN